MGGSTGGTAKTKKKGGKNPTSTNGKISTTPFDVNASLLRMEKKYDELTRELAKKLLKDGPDNDDDVHATDSTPNDVDDTVISEYIIAARAAATTKRRSVLPDWVPIAQLCLKRPESEYHEGAADPMVRTAISTCCRELSHVAAVGAPIFATIARNEIQYSVESIDSFRKFVYDDVVDGRARSNPDGMAMTKAVARQTLGLTSTVAAAVATSGGGSSNGDGTTAAVDVVTKADIKQAYRKLSFEFHPDRFVGTPDECEDARVRFGQVQLAYETLTSGVRDGRDGGISWYESLGGRARTGFVGPVQLLPLASAQEQLQRHNAEIAIATLDPNLIQSFVARNLRSE